MYWESLRQRHSLWVAPLNFGKIWKSFFVTRAHQHRDNLTRVHMRTPAASWEKSLDSLPLTWNHRFPVVPTVWLPGFPVRIPPGLLRIPGYSYQQSYQDLARSWKFIQEVQESRSPTRKFKDHPFNFIEIFRMQSQDFLGFSRIIQDLSRLLLKVLSLQFPRFCLKFQDAVGDFPGFFKSIQDPSGLLLKVLNLKIYMIYPIRSQ